MKFDMCGAAGVLGAHGGDRAAEAADQRRRRSIGSTTNMPSRHRGEAGRRRPGDERASSSRSSTPTPRGGSSSPTCCRTRSASSPPRSSTRRRSPAPASSRWATRRPASWATTTALVARGARRRPRAGEPGWQLPDVGRLQGPDQVGRRRHQELRRPAGRARSPPRCSSASSSTSYPWVHLDVAGTAYSESRPRDGAAAGPDRHSGRHLRRVRARDAPGDAGRRVLRRVLLLGLGVVAGAVLPATLSAQVPVRPDTARAPRDTAPTRVDSARARRSGRRTADTIRVPTPARADSVLRNDSPPQGIVPLPRGAAGLRAADTIKAPLARAEAPPLLETGPAAHLRPLTAMFATGALTLADLLERVPGANGVHRRLDGRPRGRVASSGDLRRVRVFLDGVELDALDPRAGNGPRSRQRPAAARPRGGPHRARRARGARATRAAGA